VISVRKIYTDVCDSILEPGQLTGQTLTDSQFLLLLNDTLRVIFQASSCFCKLINVETYLGVRLYDHPNFVNEISLAQCDESTINQGSGNYWDNSDYRWQQDGPGTPQEWRSDQILDNKIEIRPAPAWTGYTPTLPVNGLLGTLSETSAAVTFDIDYDPASLGMYGTISKTDLGAVYTEFTAPMFGVIGTISEATLNITEMAVYTLQDEIEDLDAYIPDLPESFAPYVKFGVLSYIYAMDGECKNENLSKYYKKRLEELISLLGLVDGEAMMRKR
jgi:hypothetical protein